MADDKKDKKEIKKDKPVEIKAEKRNYTLVSDLRKQQEEAKRNAAD